MSETFYRKLYKAGGSLCLTIPEDYAKVSKLKDGELVKVSVEKVNK